jgi:cell division inhibitor SepF
MFERFMEKFKGRDRTEDEMEFKSIEELDRREAISAPQEKPEPAPAQPLPVRSHDSVELKVIRPESYEEASIVADHLLAGSTVVLNLEALERPLVHRMLDFLNGVTYCSDGEIKKVAPNTFIVTPHGNVDISDM